VYKCTKPGFDPFVPSTRCKVNGKEGITYSFSGKCEALVSTFS